MKYYKISKLCNNSTVSKFVTKEVSLSGRSDQVILTPIWAIILFEVSALLDVRHCNLQSSCNLMMQSWANRKNYNFRPNLPPPPNFFSSVLPLLVVRQCPKLSSYAIPGKTNEPNLKKWQKPPYFGPNFGSNLCPKHFLQVLPLLVVRHCSRLWSCAIWRKTNEPNLRKWQKN